MQEKGGGAGSTGKGGILTKIGMQLLCLNLNTQEMKWQKKCIVILLQFLTLSTTGWGQEQPLGPCKCLTLSHAHTLSHSLSLSLSLSLSSSSSSYNNSHSFKMHTISQQMIFRAVALIKIWSHSHAPATMWIPYSLKSLTSYPLD